jgi:hypothetical protein
VHNCPCPPMMTRRPAPVRGYVSGGGWTPSTFSNLLLSFLLLLVDYYGGGGEVVVVVGVVVVLVVVLVVVVGPSVVVVLVVGPSVVVVLVVGPSVVVVLVVGPSVVVVLDVSPHSPKVSPCPRWPRSALSGRYRVFSAGVPGLWQMGNFSGLAAAKRAGTSEPSAVATNSFSARRRLKLPLTKPRASSSKSGRPLVGSSDTNLSSLVWPCLASVSSPARWVDT